MSPETGDTHETNDARLPARAGAVDGPEAALRGRDVALILLGFVGCLGLGVAGVVAVAIFTPHGEKLFARSLPLAVAAIVWQTVILIACIYVLGLRRRSLPWSAIGFRPAPVGWCAAAVFAGVTLVFLLDAVASAFETPLSELSEVVARVVAPEGFSWAGMAAMVAAGGVIAPLGEEALYRGVLYGWLRRKWGPLAGTIVSALIFGISHWNPYWAAFATVIGVVLAVVYEKSGSLWPPILLHMSYNCTGIVVLYASIR